MKKILALCLSLPLMALAESPAFSVVPNGELPKTIAPHSTLKVNYTITNLTEGTLSNIGVRSSPMGHTPLGVTQISSVPNCTDPFTLKAGESCNLLLLVKADELEDNEATGGPEVCNASPPPVRCSVPKLEDELDIHVGAP